MLIDPQSNKPFYVGKGVNNRVFDHIKYAIDNPNISTEKCDTIRQIGAENVRHVIVTHGLAAEEDAFRIESVLIDVLNYSGIQLTNEVSGHHANESGIMTADEITRLYSAAQLNSIGENCVIININGQYNRAMGSKGIYDATKQTWNIAPWRLEKIKYVLSEYRGLIIEVFEVENWYPNKRPYGMNTKKAGQYYTGYGFNGHIAEKSVRDLYINKSIAHKKVKGRANPLTYNI